MAIINLGDLEIRHNRNIRIFNILMVMYIIFFGLVNIAVKAETVNSLNPLFDTLEAESFKEYPGWERIKTPETPFSRTKGVFEGYSREGRLLGTVIHLASPGYGGPVNLLIDFDPLGIIIKINVFRHNETDCHIIGMTKGKFLEQFYGVTLLDKLRLLVGLKASGRGEVQAMTSGTITSRAVTEAVVEARKVFYELYLGEL